MSVRIYEPALTSGTVLGPGRCHSLNLSAAPIFLLLMVRKQFTRWVLAGAEGHTWNPCPVPCTLCLLSGGQGGEMLRTWGAGGCPEPLGFRAVGPCPGSVHCLGGAPRSL